jgi:hypothetical protein
MRLFFTLASILLVIINSIAQERTISGRLTSTEDGSPLPGINITIKGTTIGTSTDADGYYSINVPIGATLVFSFIGLQSREVIVTENNLQPVNASSQNQTKGHNKRKALLKPIPKSLFQDSIPNDGIGFVTLNDQTPTYFSKGNIDPTAIRSIKKSGNKYNLKMDTDPYKRNGFGLLFTTSLGFERVNKLPSLQGQYSQGQPNAGNYEWAGADQQEIFSWGPLVRTLEFDGSNYPFDKNGKLVSLGSGNGKAAKKYDPLSIFRTAISNVNELMLTLPTPKSSTLVLDIENRRREGIIPNSNYTKTNISAALKDFNISDKFQLSTTISYNKSTGNLLLRGANLTSIVGSILRTPVTFDNANALSNERAINSSESYQLQDGTVRSHSPGIADNPYGLINDLPDRETYDRLMSSINLEYNPFDRFSFVFNGNIDQQWNKSIFGNAPGYSGFTEGRFTRRNDDQTFANAILTSAYRVDLYDDELKFSLSYQTQLMNRELDRTDGFNFSSSESFGQFEQADSIAILSKNFNRSTHEVILNAQYQRYSWLNIRVTNRRYFSNTVNYNQFTNFFPSGSFSIDLAELLYLWPVDQLKLFGTLSRSIREAPLLYSNWSYQSTSLPVENYNSFYESSEIFFNKNLSPETEVKFETGIKFRGFNNLIFELVYFNNLTKDFILPVNSSDGFNLTNIATVHNYGATLSIGYSGYFYEGNWGTNFQWSTYNSKVEDLYSSDQWAPLAGFESVQSVLAEGKPFGAIYGSTYVRNSEGKKVIGNDGFPIEDNSLKMIGSPIPDLILGWSSFIKWKQLKLSFLFDYKKGGEIYNGTSSALDYLGKSSTTGELRGTSNYIFDGVDVNDNPNLIPVNFSDPTKPLSENRWVRYGWDGVGEAYIEDASWFRLSEATLSYTLNIKQAKVREVKFSLIGRNLFLVTPYSGVDPSSMLFGYSTGSGLDLFNLPSTRSYSAQISIKL